VREYAYPNWRNSQLVCGDEGIERIFRAAVETYRQNTLDVFMDCPTRERAGWLCDSYFTAQAAQFFSGEATVEKTMLENYTMARSFPNIPQGMLPMCYPAEFLDGSFIPQWSMWYVIELEGYLTRSADADIETFRSLCYGLVHYLHKFRNEDGLLEKLDNWNFIEWSQANDWVQDVSYPTNMMYVGMLERIATWYEDVELAEEARQVREVIIEQSFDGSFFHDNAVRDPDGSLRRTDNRSEVCQYYAFFFGIAEAREGRFRGLHDTIIRVFGPDRKLQGIMPEIAYANAFIGNYLRLELLLRWRCYDQALRECKTYFSGMTDLTGTLWEHDRVAGSLNHGFASFAGVVLLRCLLGIQEINQRQGYVRLDFHRTGMPDTIGKVGTAYGEIRIERKTDKGRQTIRYDVPEGFRCIVESEE
jgi:alpha-L-rhamnosidase